MWNTDTWADGEFEPLDEQNSGCLHSQVVILVSNLIYIHSQVTQNWTKHGANVKRKKFNAKESWKPDELHVAH